jgi:dethiobiotin synthetase
MSDNGQSSRTIVVTGTDTGIGKTVFCAGLAALLDADYWKPVQAGLDEGTDSEQVRMLGRLSDDRIHKEAYRLKLPASPHYAAEREAIVIERAHLSLPQTPRPLIVEGAGGALVPFTPDFMFADLCAYWRAPVVIVARTSLGTINHSLLTIEALRARNISILGIAFVGEAQANSEWTICDRGNVRHLGRLPLLDPLNAATLKESFAGAFRAQDFVSGTGTGSVSKGLTV